MTTPRLGAPELVSAQSVPETTVNEQVRFCEQGATRFLVVDKDLATPPGSPSDGACYIVAASPTGAWSGWATRIAFYASGWKSIVAQEGMRAYIQDEDAEYEFDGSAWASVAGLGTPDLDDLGDVNAPTPSDGDVLTWDSTPGEWVALAPTGAGAFVLDDATDVDTTGVANGDVLTYDSGSGDWIASAPTGGGAAQYERTRSIPAAANFSLQNAGSASITDGTYGLKLSVPSDTSNLRFVKSNSAPPATPYSMIVRSVPLSPYDNSNLQWPSLVARNSSNGRMVFYGAYNSGQHAVQRWSSYTTFSANALAPITAFNLMWLPWKRMRNDGTNLYFGRSPDGETWFEFHTEPLATYLTAAGGTLDQIGFGLITVTAGLTAEAIFQSFEVV